MTGLIGALAAEVTARAVLRGGARGRDARPHGLPYLPAARDLATARPA